MYTHDYRVLRAMLLWQVPKELLYRIKDNGIGIITQLLIRNDVLFVISLTTSRSLNRSIRHHQQTLHQSVTVTIDASSSCNGSLARNGAPQTDHEI